VIVDAFGIWPLSHFWAIFSGAVVISVRVSAELPIKWGIAASASIFAIAALVYFVSPPILLEETETHGWLLPATRRRLKTDATKCHDRRVLFCSSQEPTGL
jgi:hypothetical protein